MNGLLSCPQDGVWLAAPDLLGPYRNLDATAHLSGSAEEDEEEKEEEDMGQRSSSLLAARTRPKISLTWVLRGDRQNSSTITTVTSTTTASTAPAMAADDPLLPSATLVNSPERPAARSDTRAHVNGISGKVHNGSNSSSGSRSASAITKRALSEPSLLLANSESGRSGRSSRERHRHRRTRTRTRTPRHKTERERRRSRFGYEIQDVNAFLTKVCLFAQLECNKMPF
jgi:hypothetical protein